MLRPHRRLYGQQGIALLALLLLLLVAASFVLLHQPHREGWESRHDADTGHALAQAKEALVGYAATYRERHPGQVNGYLPCPDLDNDGEAESSCGTQDTTAVGRLPWKTLKLPPLTDGAGDCLWYVVSGNTKNSPATPVLNWDTAGLFQIRDDAGLLLAGQTAHLRPWAAVLAPGPLLGSQQRPGDGASPCSGSNVPSDYLEGLGGLNAPGEAVPTLTLGTAASRRDGSNNDRGIWLDGREIFSRLQQRADFKDDIDTLLQDLEHCLNQLPVASLPPPAGNNKGMGIFATDGSASGVFALCLPAAPAKRNLWRNWQDNLLYALPATANGDGGCRGALLFAGARSSGQSRADPGERHTAANYLEGGNAGAFTGNGNLAGGSHFDKDHPGADLVRCIRGLPAGALQTGFAEHLEHFVTAGPGGGVTTDAAARSATFAATAGASGSCLWYGRGVPVAGRVLRSYYEFQFSRADPSARLGGTDLGGGFTLQLVQTDLGLPGCGSDSRLGTLQPGNGWLASLFVETDIYYNGSHRDPTANHAAILSNGNPTHDAGSMGSPCNGRASGCRFTPADTFEESPRPLPHNQRLELSSGCNRGCGSCLPSRHGRDGRDYVQISVWVDCRDCNDLVSPLERTLQAPTMERCLALDVSLNTAYVGLTSGFPAVPENAQALVIRNFALRSE